MDGVEVSGIFHGDFHTIETPSLEPSE